MKYCLIKIIEWIIKKRQDGIEKTTNKAFDEADLIASKIIQNGNTKKECLHYFVTGWVSDLVYYCNKCNKELDEIYGEQILRDYKLKDGVFIKNAEDDNS